MYVKKELRNVKLRNKTFSLLLIFSLTLLIVIGYSVNFMPLLVAFCWLLICT